MSSGALVSPMCDTTRQATEHARDDYRLPMFEAKFVVVRWTKPQWERAGWNAVLLTHCEPLQGAARGLPSVDFVS
jgi:hypothetical protein